MKEIMFLKNIYQLFNGWGLSVDDWFLNDGFFLKPFLRNFYDLKTKDHWHVLVNKDKLPWQVNDTGQLVPPVNSDYLKVYMDFLTNNPELMIESEEQEEFKKYLTGCEKIEIDKGVAVNQVKSVKALNRLLVKKNINPNRYYELLDKAIKYAEKVDDSDVLDLLSNINSERVNGIITGESVNQENIQGEIKFIMPGKEIEDINNKIIVIEEVLPKHLSLVLKSLGVISVVGGLTSHSAIVCREFNKPCLLGVKTAFYDLREGDFVEIDSLNKKIKILKPNNG